MFMFQEELNKVYDNLKLDLPWLERLDLINDMAVLAPELCMEVILELLFLIFHSVLRSLASKDQPFDLTFVTLFTLQYVLNVKVYSWSFLDKLWWTN